MIADSELEEPPLLTCRLVQLERAEARNSATSQLCNFRLDVEVLHIQSVVFDELAAGFDLVAH